MSSACWLGSCRGVSQPRFLRVSPRFRLLPVGLGLLRTHVTTRITRLEQAAGVDYTGAMKSRYGGAELKSVATKLQVIVQDGSLRMELGELGFPTGQALIDWLIARASGSASCRRRAGMAF